MSKPTYQAARFYFYFLAVSSAWVNQPEVNDPAVFGVLHPEDAKHRQQVL